MTTNKVVTAYAEALPLPRLASPPLSSDTIEQPCWLQDPTGLHQRLLLAVWRRAGRIEQ
jgi:hypothetical protein